MPSRKSVSKNEIQRIIREYIRSANKKRYLEALSPNKIGDIISYINTYRLARVREECLALDLDEPAENLSKQDIDNIVSVAFIRQEKGLKDEKKKKQTEIDPLYTKEQVKQRASEKFKILSEIDHKQSHCGKFSKWIPYDKLCHLGKEEAEQIIGDRNQFYTGRRSPPMDPDCEYYNNFLNSNFQSKFFVVPPKENLSEDRRPGPQTASLEDFFEYQIRMYVRNHKDFFESLDASHDDMVKFNKIIISLLQDIQWLDVNEIKKRVVFPYKLSVPPKHVEHHRELPAPDEAVYRAAQRHLPTPSEDLDDIEISFEREFITLFNHKLEMLNKICNATYDEDQDRYEKYEGKKLENCNSLNAFCLPPPAPPAISSKLEYVYQKKYFDEIFHAPKTYLEIWNNVQNPVPAPGPAFTDFHFKNLKRWHDDEEKTAFLGDSYCKVFSFVPKIKGYPSIFDINLLLSALHTSPPDEAPKLGNYAKAWGTGGGQSFGMECSNNVYVAFPGSQLKQFCEARDPGNINSNSSLGFTFNALKELGYKKFVLVLGFTDFGTGIMFNALTKERPAGNTDEGEEDATSYFSPSGLTDKFIEEFTDKRKDAFNTFLRTRARGVKICYAEMPKSPFTTYNESCMGFYDFSIGKEITKMNNVISETEGVEAEENKRKLTALKERVKKITPTWFNKLILGEVVGKSHQKMSSVIEIIKEEKRVEGEASSLPEVEHLFIPVGTLGVDGQLKNHLNDLRAGNMRDLHYDYSLLENLFYDSNRVLCEKFNIKKNTPEMLSWSRTKQDKNTCNGWCGWGVGCFKNIGPIVAFSEFYNNKKFSFIQIASAVHEEPAQGNLKRFRDSFLNPQLVFGSGVIKTDYAYLTSPLWNRMDTTGQLKNFRNFIRGATKTGKNPPKQFNSSDDPPEVWKHFRILDFTYNNVPTMVSTDIAFQPVDNGQLLTWSPPPPTPGPGTDLLGAIQGPPPSSVAQQADAAENVEDEWQEVRIQRQPGRGRGRGRGRGYVSARGFGRGTGPAFGRGRRGGSKKSRKIKRMKNTYKKNKKIKRSTRKNRQRKTKKYLK